MRWFTIGCVMCSCWGCVRAPMANKDALSSADAGIAWDAAGPLKPATAPVHVVASASDHAAAGAGGAQRSSDAAGRSADGAGGSSGHGATGARASAAGAGGAVADQPPSAAGASGSPPLAPRDAMPSHVGDLVISEIMIDPKTLSDAQGEWIELANTSDVSLDLQGCAIDYGQSGAHPIADSVIAAPGGFVTIARSDQVGFTPDYVTALSFTNTADTIAVRCGSVEIDRVSYDKSSGFPVIAGAALSLDPDELSAIANDRASAWCAATQSYGPELGTPGQPNPMCSHAVDAPLDAGMVTDALLDSSMPTEVSPMQDAGVPDASTTPDQTSPDTTTLPDAGAALDASAIPDVREASAARRALGTAQLSAVDGSAKRKPR